MRHHFVGTHSRSKHRLGDIPCICTLTLWLWQRLSVDCGRQERMWSRTLAVAIKAVQESLLRRALLRNPFHKRPRGSLKNPTLNPRGTLYCHRWSHARLSVLVLPLQALRGTQARAMHLGFQATKGHGRTRLHCHLWSRGLVSRHHPLHLEPPSARRGRINTNSHCTCSRLSARMLTTRERGGWTTVRPATT